MTLEPIEVHDAKARWRIEDALSAFVGLGDETLHGLPEAQAEDPWCQGLGQEICRRRFEVAVTLEHVMS